MTVILDLTLLRAANTGVMQRHNEKDKGMFYLLQQVIVNGTDVTANITNKLSDVVPSQSSVMLTLPLESPLTPGSFYTVVLQYQEAGAAESVAGGRLAKTHFPIESWPKSHECPFPTINDDNYQVWLSHCMGCWVFKARLVHVPMILSIC